MASSLRKEILEAKLFGLQLEKDVEEFENRLRQGIERTKKSIEELPIDCELNCIKVWQEFDEFLEKTRLKAAELCNQMKEKTSEEERKWRQILEEKENLLEEAGKWLLGLRHLLVASIDDVGVVSGVRSLGAELSGRLHESSTPAEGGHFVVTFPEWCQRSLDQLQEEIVDFKTVKPWPPRELEMESEFRLRDSNLGTIRSIAVSDEDGHVFVVDWGDDSIKEFGETGEIVGRCPLGDGGFSPRDICCLSQDHFVVCGGRARGGLVFLARTKRRPFLEKEKRIKTEENEFSSLCQTNENLFVCDWNFEEILCYSKEGNEIKRIQLEKSPESGFLFSLPLLRVDPTTGNLWRARRGESEFFGWNENGQILQIVETEKGISDFCADEFGHFYFCNEEGIFSVLPEKILYKFPKKSGIDPTISVSGKKLFVCFENDGKTLMKIFKIN